MMPTISSRMLIEPFPNCAMDASNEEGNISDDGEEDQIVLVMTGLTSYWSYIRAHFAKEGCCTSILSGAMYYEELLNSRSPIRFSNVARMSVQTFHLLLRELETTRLLPSTSRIHSGERLLIFLFILTGKSNRAAQDRFQHGPATIGRIVRQCLAAIKARWDKFVCLPNSTTPVEIQQSAKVSFTSKLLRNCRWSSHPSGSSLFNCFAV